MIKIKHFTAILAFVLGTFLTAFLIHMLVVKLGINDVIAIWAQTLPALPFGIWAALEEMSYQGRRREKEKEKEKVKVLTPPSDQTTP